MRSPRVLAALGLAVVVGLAVSDVGAVPMIVAVLAGYLIIRSGFTMFGAMSQPVPEPPPVGELRKVRIEFRCSICGSEVRMTVANDEMPDPPKHCLEEMDLVTPIE